MSKRLWTSTSEYATLYELLATRATDQPDKVGYSFLLDEQQEPAVLTYTDLNRRARVRSLSAGTNDCDR